MSLQTDLIFVHALQQSADIERLVDDRIYMTAIPRPDEEVMNEPLPYIIVTFDGIQTQEQTKDSDYDSEYDTVQIGIEIAAETRPALAELSNLVRQTIRDYFSAMQEDELDDDDFKKYVPLSAQPSGGQVIYDDFKPCYWLTLQYTCDTYSFDDE